jgi:hypothetical protein
MATRRIDPPRGRKLLSRRIMIPGAREESSATGRAPGHRDRVRVHEGSVGVTLEEGLVALPRGGGRHPSLHKASRRPSSPPGPRAAVAGRSPPVERSAESGRVREASGWKWSCLRARAGIRGRSAGVRRARDREHARASCLPTPGRGHAGAGAARSGRPIEFVGPRARPHRSVRPSSRWSAEPAPAVQFDPTVEAVERRAGPSARGQHAAAIEAAGTHLESAEGAEGRSAWICAGGRCGCSWAWSRHALGDADGGTRRLSSAAVTRGARPGSPRAARSLSPPSPGPRRTSCSPPRSACLRLGGAGGAAPHGGALARMAPSVAAAGHQGGLRASWTRRARRCGKAMRWRGGGLLQRRQFAHARRLVREALDSEDLPAPGAVRCLPSPPRAW